MFLSSRLLSFQSFFHCAFFWRQPKHSHHRISLPSLSLKRCKKNRNVLVEALNRVFPRKPLILDPILQSFKRKFMLPGSHRHRRLIGSSAQFRIDCSGNLSELKLTSPSRNRKANMAVLRAISQSAPFEPLPLEYPETYVPVSFSFNYELD